MRATPSALGIGIAAMVAVLGISQSSRADLLADLDRLGTNLVSVTPGQKLTGDTASLSKDAPSMVISVPERRREIGPRRALGATRRHVALQFLSESLLLSGLGGVAGVSLGALVTIAYASSQEWETVVPVAGLAGGVIAARPGERLGPCGDQVWPRRWASTAKRTRTMIACRMMRPIQERRTT